MTTATFTSVRNNFRHYCDIAIENREPVIITNQNNDNVVLVSEDDWNSIQETAFIAQDSNKMSRLATAMHENSCGKGEVFDNVASMRESLLHVF